MRGNKRNPSVTELVMDDQRAAQWSPREMQRKLDMRDSGDMLNPPGDTITVKTLAACGVVILIVYVGLVAALVLI